MNNRNRPLIIAILTLLSFSVKAQFSIGMEAGYTNNHLNTDISNRTFTQNENGHGFSAGVVIDYECLKWLHFQSGISLIQKNYTFQRTGDYADVFDAYTNTYIQLPVIAQAGFPVFKKLKVLFSAGMYTAYWAFAKRNGKIPNLLNSIDSTDGSGQSTQYLVLSSYSEKYSFDSRKDNRFELGWLTGAGVSYQLNNNYVVYLQGRYYQSLTDQQKKYMVNQVSKYNDTYQIVLGALIQLNRKN